MYQDDVGLRVASSVFYRCIAYQSVRLFSSELSVAWSYRTKVSCG